MRPTRCWLKSVPRPSEDSPSARSAPPPERGLILSCVIWLIAVAFFGPPSSAQAPAGYYDSVDTSSSAALRTTLHEVIDDHVRFPYTSSSTDTWNILEIADEDPGNAQNILDVYRNATYPKAGGGNSFYNREHSWPKSYGFPNDGSTNYPYTDCHHLFLCDSGYNSSRSNKPYRTCDPTCSEKVTDFNFGQGGGSGFYPGNSNWTSGSQTSGSWETWGARRGDVARALLYMDVRYEGGVHGVTGVAEPDLILTDSEALIAASNTGSNETVAYMGMLSVLLQWHQEDPVDSLELWRNDAVYSFQGNRNPFIDHPEWVDCLFNGNCAGGGDVIAPLAPTGLAAIAGDGLIDLDWNDNTEPDLAGYDVYRSTTPGGPYTRLNAALLSVSQYSDSGLSNGTAYYYVVTATDTSLNVSGNSLEVSATPTGSGGGGTSPSDPWINEFHYDNASSDVGEFIELAGPAGLDLGGWSLVGYNGNGGADYKTVSLSGILPDQGGCIGTLSFAFSGLQNGAPDGIALVDPAGAVIEFISYEGSLTATAGPAQGMVSVDVLVSESGSTAVGDSLQLGGTGSDPSAFFWQAAQASTAGLPNQGQVFSGGCGGGGGMPPAAPTGLVAVAGEAQVQLTWNNNTESDLDGYDVHRSTTAGGPYNRINTAILLSPAFTDFTVSNGNTYYYVVTAINLAGTSSALSNEVSATPMDTTAPAAPSMLGATAGDGSVALDWADNTEPDLAGYDIKRATSSAGPFVQINSGTLTTSDYVDGSVTNGVTYYYVVTAQDNVGNTSPESASASATPFDSTPPGAPTGLTAVAGDAEVQLDWADNGEPDLAGYNVYRSLSSGTGFALINGSPLTGSVLLDTAVSNGTTYFYFVTAVDGAGNESAGSPEVSGTPQSTGGGPPALPWINELHYDNSGKDKNEFIEIAGPAGADLNGWQLVAYNGNGGKVYKTLNLSGLIPDQGAGAGTLSFAFSKLQNGAPDGIALVDDGGSVVQFLSYEGSLVASNGVAAGLTSTDIGVSEASSTPQGFSLQLGGSGSQYSDFTWQAPQADTPGSVNAGQSLSG